MPPRPSSRSRRNLPASSAGSCEGVTSPPHRRAALGAGGSDDARTVRTRPPAGLRRPRPARSAPSALRRSALRAGAGSRSSGPGRRPPAPAAPDRLGENGRSFSFSPNTMIADEARSPERNGISRCTSPSASHCCSSRGRCVHPASRSIEFDHNRIEPRHEGRGERALERQRPQPPGTRQQPPGLPIGDQDVGLRQMQCRPDLVAEHRAQGLEGVARWNRSIDAASAAEQPAGVDRFSEEHAVEPLQQRAAHGEHEEQRRQRHQRRRRRGGDKRANRLVAVAHQRDQEQRGRGGGQRTNREAGEPILNGPPDQQLDSP